MYFWGRQYPMSIDRASQLSIASQTDRSYDQNAPDATNDDIR